jgi:ribosome-associated protein
LRENRKCGERRKGGCSVKHAHSYSTIHIGGEFLPHTDSTTLNLTSTKENEWNDPAWLTPVRAAESKKATDVKVLDLTAITSFADYFIICTGASGRQIQAITDEITARMKQRGERPVSVEGYDQGDWVLSDYGDIVVHVFSEKARAFYDLDRLWRQAKPIEIPPE